MTLVETIQDKGVRNGIVADCTQLIEKRVAAKGGISGLALKATYGAVKSVGAQYVPGAIGRLLPEVFAALDPMWAEGERSGDPVSYLSQNRPQAADALLGVTDARIEKTNNGVVRASYNKLRKSVKGDVEAAVPDLASIIARHADTQVQ